MSLTPLGATLAAGEVRVVLCTGHVGLGFCRLSGNCMAGVGLTSCRRGLEVGLRSQTEWLPAPLV